MRTEAGADAVLKPAAVSLVRLVAPAALAPHFLPVSVAFAYSLDLTMGVTLLGVSIAGVGVASILALRTFVL